jgi:hypothetical protein
MANQRRIPDGFKPEVHLHHLRVRTPAMTSWSWLPASSRAA